MMDFSRFRESGDLSDMTVVLGSQEHKLHKFPLYARSDYFCELARSRPDGEADPVRIELNNFPGGADTFGQVADFCYNMPVSMTKENVVAIRCAAEHLKMFGPGNLVGVADKFLTDAISAAKLHGSTNPIVALLLQCKAIGETAKTSGVVDLCSDALVECWVKPRIKLNSVGNKEIFTKAQSTSKGIEGTSAFTRVQSQETTQSTDRLDEVSINCMMSLCPDWFSSILSKARDKAMSWSELGRLAVKYISLAMDKENGNTSSASRELQMNTEPTPPADSEKDTDTTTTKLTSSSVPSLNERTSSTPLTSESSMDLGLILDQVLLVLPEQAYSIPEVTMEWLTKVLRMATAHGCKCRGHLVRVAGEMLSRLSPEDLCIISPSVLHDIVVDASVDESAKAGNAITSSNSLHCERACKLVDTYMGQMSAKGVLTAETFRLLASATKDYSRPSHDSLYGILDFVLKSEKDSLTPEQLVELPALVNFDLLSETNLEKALKDNVVPASKIARSALQLCTRLKSELDSVKYIAEMQEEDIQKYQNAAVAATNQIKSASSLTTASDPSTSNTPRQLSTYALRERGTDTVYMDSLNRGRDNKSPGESLQDDELDSEDNHGADHMRAAQSVLTAARHKLSIPMYTGYRPTYLTRLASPSGESSRSHVNHHLSARDAVEHDISLEEELEFKFDRSFRSLDPRVRHHRFGSHVNATGQRTYFPYSNYSHKY